MSVSPEEVKIFTCDLSRMIENGQSFMRSLTSLIEGQLNEEFRQIIEQITQEVAQGHTLSGAIRKYPDVFSQDYADTIRQGEVNGNLDTALQQLCGH